MQLVVAGVPSAMVVREVVDVASGVLTVPGDRCPSSTVTLDHTLGPRRPRLPERVSSGVLATAGNRDGAIADAYQYREEKGGTFSRRIIVDREAGYPSQLKESV